MQLHCSYFANATSFSEWIKYILAVDIIGHSGILNLTAQDLINHIYKSHNFNCFTSFLKALLKYSFFKVFFLIIIDLKWFYFTSLRNHQIWSHFGFGFQFGFGGLLPMAYNFFFLLLCFLPGHSHLFTFILLSPVNPNFLSLSQEVSKALKTKV